MWSDRPASELVFLTRDQLVEEEKKAEKLHPEIHGTVKYKVLRIWRQLHPDGNLQDFTYEQFMQMSNDIARLHIILREMRARCYNPEHMNYRWYGAKGIGVCKEWNELDETNYTKRGSSDEFVLWSLRNGYHYDPHCKRGDQLSISRKDLSKDYSPENCRWIPQRENAKSSGKHTCYATLLGRNREFVSTFPDCVVTGKIVVWGLVLERHFDNDWDALKKFLLDHGYTKQSTCVIHNRILNARGSHEQARVRGTWLKGRKWFTDGKRNAFTYECPPGFRPGQKKVMTRKPGPKPKSKVEPPDSENGSRRGKSKGANSSSPTGYP